MNMLANNQFDKLLKSLQKGMPARVGVKSGRRTLPCVKLRNGGCPIARYERIDCHMQIKIGCFFKGDDGRIDPGRVQAFLRNPDSLGSWLAWGLYGPSGVSRG